MAMMMWLVTARRDTAVPAERAGVWAQDGDIGHHGIAGVKAGAGSGERSVSIKLRNVAEFRARAAALSEHLAQR